MIVIDTDPLISTEEGGAWWDVAVPEVSQRTEVNAARKAYEEATQAEVGRELNACDVVPFRGDDTEASHGKT